MGRLKPADGGTVVIYKSLEIGQEQEQYIQLSCWITKDLINDVVGWKCTSKPKKMNFSPKNIATFTSPIPPSDSDRVRVYGTK